MGGEGLEGSKLILDLSSISTKGGLVSLAYHYFWYAVFSLRTKRISTAEYYDVSMMEQAITVGPFMVSISSNLQKTGKV